MGVVECCLEECREVLRCLRGVMGVCIVMRVSLEVYMFLGEVCRGVPGSVSVDMYTGGRQE